MSYRVPPPVGGAEGAVVMLFLFLVLSIPGAACLDWVYQRFEPVVVEDMGVPFALCMTGPIAPEGMVPTCTCWDCDGDGDIDLQDFAVVQRIGKHK